MIDTQTLKYVRILINDPSQAIFDDDTIASVLEFEGHPKLAAAQLLDRIAVTEVLLSKKITTQDLSTDGPAVAEALRKLAAQLRQQYADETSETAWGIASWNAATISPAGPPEGTERPWGL